MKTNESVDRPDAVAELPKLNREQSTMRSGITEALRHRIIDGTLPPGTRVSEEWVSREMGVSRGPVREALRELENEGLLVVYAYRGAFVNGISTDELRDVLIPVRLVLEREACLRALPIMTESDFRALDEITDEMRAVAEASESGALLALVDLDVRYHELLTELGGQYHTLQIWRSIQPRIRAGFYRLGSKHQDLREISEEHKTLLAALRTRDPLVAVTALETHICTTQLALLDQLESSGEVSEDGVIG
jgi:DNA-binding GntR family transcriptional regulator